MLKRPHMVSLLSVPPRILPRPSGPPQDGWSAVGGGNFNECVGARPGFPLTAAPGWRTMGAFRHHAPEGSAVSRCRVVCCLVALLLATGTAQAQELKPFTSKEAGIKVLLP